MSVLLPFGGRTEAPKAPPEIREAVELYARESGRTGTIEFATAKPMKIGDQTVMVGPNCWMVKLSLKPNDPAMRLWQQGHAPEPPAEVVWIQERNPDDGKVVGWNGSKPVRGTPFRALDIHQMGAAGVREFLDRGNTWSGRGDSTDLVGSVEAAYAKDEHLRETHRERVEGETREELRDQRRQRFKVPFLNVGIDLRGE